MKKNLRNNPYVTKKFEKGIRSRDHATAQAVLALAFEQRQRNRLAAITATNRGIKLPEDMRYLLEE